MKMFNVMFSVVIRSLCVVSMIVLSSISCDRKDGGGNDDPSVLVQGSVTRGCIQGIAINGLTGERIPVPYSDGRTKGVFVLVHDRLIPAIPLTSSNTASAAEAHLIGKYYVCDIPLDEYYTIFASIDGFQAFESIVHISSTAAPRAAQAENDLVKSEPTALINFRLYPKGAGTNDLKFVVTFDGAPQKDATVQLRPSGSNFLDLIDSEFFLSPISVGQKPLSATTDEAGEALFSKDELVLGAKYNYIVFPPNNGADRTTVIQEEGKFVVGVRTSDGAAGKSDPYIMYVNLKQPAAKLEIVSRSPADNNNFNPSGIVSFYFNRPIELIPGIQDSISAELSNSHGAELVEDIKNNSATEQVIVEIVGNKLTLAPKFKVNPDPMKEGALSIVYSGVKIRVASSPDLMNSYDLQDIMVYFFGGQDVPPSPQKLEILTGSVVGQGVVNIGSSNVNTALSPIEVKVSDQNGLPYENAKVTFTTASGHGMVKIYGEGGTGSSSCSGKTDDEGKIKVTWIMPGYAGEKTLYVTTDGVKEPVKALATAVE